MKRTTSLALAAVPVALALTACSSSTRIPDPTPQDYANQMLLAAAHPGMNCYLTWQGYYVTNCYGYGVQPPYSARVYAPKGCTCPTPLPKPKNYTTPKPVGLSKTSSSAPVNATPPKPAATPQVNKPVKPVAPAKK